METWIPADQLLLWLEDEVAKLEKLYHARKMLTISYLEGRLYQAKETLKFARSLAGPLRLVPVEPAKPPLPMEYPGEPTRWRRT